MTENLCSSMSSGEILLYLQNQIDCSQSIAVDFEKYSPARANQTIWSGMSCSLYRSFSSKSSFLSCGFLLSFKI